MKTIDELVDELAVRLNSGQTVKQKKVAKPVSAPKPEVKKECKKQCKCGGNCKHESPEKMTIAMAKELAEAVEKAATILGVKVVVAIRDEGANLVLLHAMDDSYIASVQASQDKAYTAVALKMPTHIALDESRGGSLDGLTNGNGILLLGGGYPLKVLEQTKKYTAESEFRAAQKNKIQLLQWLPTRILKPDLLEEVGKVNGR